MRGKQSKRRQVRTSSTDNGWTEETLDVERIIRREDFQPRANGTTSTHVRYLKDCIEQGDTLPPIDVAKIGNGLFVVDGWHRLEAYRALGDWEVVARVKAMTHEEAMAYADKANLSHGLNLNRADKKRIWERYVQSGKHLGGEGRAKSLRTIRADLNSLYSVETVRKKLKALGLEVVDEDEGKPFDLRERDDDYLQQEMMDDIRGKLMEVEQLYDALDIGWRKDVIKDAIGSLAVAVGHKVEGLDADPWSI